MWNRIRKPLIGLAVLLLLAFIAIQFVPVDRSNPPITMDIAAPAEVAAVLRQSCYDCHSHEVRYPWYSYVAPVSWLIAKDVREARRKLNFSTWDQYSPRKRNRRIEECLELATKNEMPLPIYLRMHDDARLTPEDLSVLSAWVAANAESGDESAPEPRPEEGRD